MAATTAAWRAGLQVSTMRTGSRPRRSDGRDPDGNRDYTPGEVNLNLNNDPDFLNISAASNNLLAPDLRQPMTNEVTAGIEHELMPNLGFRALYVYKDFSDQIATTNVRRPREAYNIPITRRDPGPDGVLNTSDDAGSVTIWDYSPAYAGAAFVANQRQNSPLIDRYQSVEFTVTKRSSGRWFGMGSFWVTKHHRNHEPVPGQPEQRLFQRRGAMDLGVEPQRQLSSSVGRAVRRLSAE